MGRVSDFQLCSLMRNHCLSRSLRISDRDSSQEEEAEQNRESFSRLFPRDHRVCTDMGRNKGQNEKFDTRFQDSHRAGSNDIESPNNPLTVYERQWAARELKAESESGCPVVLPTDQERMNAWASQNI